MYFFEGENLDDAASAINDCINTPEIVGSKIFCF
jgi:hypothetical protein